MKTSLATGTKNVGNVGTTTKLSIDPSQHAHIIDKLTDLYANRTLAAIREYATNAWDAHRDAGHTQPIEVTLPTEWSPTYVVRDYGTGISADDLKGIYVKYGSSTKRTSNAVGGMLGFGSKAGLAYTSQFSVVSTKDGVTATVVIFRGEDGVGEMSEPVIERTGLPNGTTVAIPVEDPIAYAAEARRFFAFWDTGSVLIDGKPVTSIFDPNFDFGGKAALRLDDDVILVHRTLTPGSASCAVMAGVAYPIPDFDTHNLLVAWPFVVVARVPIGTVDVTPPREALKGTPRTESMARSLTQFVQGALYRVADARVAQAETGPEAVASAAEMRTLVPFAKHLNLLWRGRTVPTKATVLGLTRTHTGVGRADCLDADTRVKRTFIMGSAVVSSTASAVAVVTGVGGSLSAYHKDAVLDLVREQGGDASRVTLLTLSRDTVAADTTWLERPERVVVLRHADVHERAKSLRPKSARSKTAALGAWDPTEELRCVTSVTYGAYRLTRLADLFAEVANDDTRTGVVVVTNSEAGTLTERRAISARLDGETYVHTTKAKHAKVVAALEEEGLEVLSVEQRSHQRVEAFADGLTEQEAALVVGDTYALRVATDTTGGLVPYNADLGALPEYADGWQEYNRLATKAKALSRRWVALRVHLTDGDPYRALFPMKVPDTHPVVAYRETVKEAVAAYPLVHAFRFHADRDRYIAMEKALRDAGISV